MNSTLVPAGGMNPLALLQTAIERGLDVDKLGKLMDLAERWEANQAAAAFGAALAKFQSVCPPIKKSRTAKMPGKNGGDGWSYQFADFEEVMKTVNPLLIDCGLSVTFSSDTSGATLKVTCFVRHGVHVQPTTLTVPIPAQMIVNDTQKFGAALSYAKRYSLAAALNLVFTGEDNDAAGLLETITAGEAETMERLLAEKGADRTRFLKYLADTEGRPVEEIGDIGRKTFLTAMDTLKRYKRKGG